MENELISTADSPDSPASALSNDALLNRLVSYFDEAAEASGTARSRAERDRDYYDGRQWTAAEEAELNQRGQAPIVVNRIKPKMDYLLGLERRLRTGARAYPRNPSDEGAARAATDAIRFVLDASEFDQMRSQVFEHLLIKGTGMAEVVVETGGTEPRIKVKAIPWDRFFIDPHARRRDLEDARYRGQVIWMDLADAKARYPNREEQLNAAFVLGQSGFGATYDDAPRRWSDKKRRRVRVVEIWYRENNRMYVTVFCRGGILKPPTASPYQDEFGKSEDPYVAAAAFITRDGERYGAVRQLIGVQDEINKRRSKALHLLSVRQVRAEKGAVPDVAASKKELARPDGWVETVPGFSFDLLPTGDMAEAQFRLLAEAKGEIDAVGAGAALSGKIDGELSGRAIQARQQGGQVELGPLFDTLRGWQSRICRKTWGRIRQFWTGEKWVRVTDDPDAPRWVGLNRPVTLMEEVERREGPLPREIADDLADDPRMTQVLRLDNPVATLDVDIVVGELPDAVAIRQEEFRLLADLAGKGVPIPPDALVEASGLSSKDRILAAIRRDPEQQRILAERDDEAARLALEQRIAEIQESHARARKTEAEAARIQASLGGAEAGVFEWAGTGAAGAVPGEDTLPGTSPETSPGITPEGDASLLPLPPEA
ncbi:MAG: hypothetical protein ACE5FN_11385 [Leptospirillia bacterium]